MKKLFDEKKLHAAFEVSLVLKGAFAMAEIVAGVLTYLITPQYVFKIVQTITQTELIEDPRDFIANYLVHAAQALSVSSQDFIALYLLSHGLVKLWLIIGLWQRKHAYYPAALLLFGLFILYQMYRYSFTHSPLLLLLTVLDGVVIWLTWTEYQYLRRTS
jgi:uncharacterized membrane protein